MKISVLEHPARTEPRVWMLSISISASVQWATPDLSVKKVSECAIIQLVAVLIKKSAISFSGTWVLVHSEM